MWRHKQELPLPKITRRRGEGGRIGEGHKGEEDKTEGTNSLSWRNDETDSQTQDRREKDKMCLRRVNN